MCARSSSRSGTSRVTGSLLGRRAVHISKAFLRNVLWSPVLSSKSALENVCPLVGWHAGFVHAQQPSLHAALLSRFRAAHHLSPPLQAGLAKPPLA